MRLRAHEYFAVSKMDKVSISLPKIETINLSQIQLGFLDSLQYDKEYCLKFLRHFGLLNKQPICCNQQMKLKARMKKIDGYQDYCSVCKNERSIRHGSFFENSHLDLYRILKLIYFYSCDVTSQKFLCREIGISTSVAVTWKNFIRDIYINYVSSISLKIGGPEVVVQIDESLICKRKFNVGRILANQDQWVFGGIDEKGDVFMTITTKRDHATLINLIKENILPGSIIWSDSWKGYKQLDKYGYFHEMVNHSKEFVTEEGVHTNRIESTWGACKRKFSHIRNKSPSLIPGYLAEYIFKKKFSDNIFPKTINIIKTIYTF